MTSIQRENLKGGPCLVEDCTRKALTRDGICRIHSQRRRDGEPDWQRPVPPKAPSGSGHVDKDGYRLIQHNGHQCREHRVFAEQALGRPLLSTEDVHHVNGNRADNRTVGPFVMDERGRLRSGNLEVWSTAQPAGQEIGPKVEWAVDLLVTYGQFDLNALRRVLTAHGDVGERERYSALALAS
jgi:hypothetical protein